MLALPRYIDRMTVHEHIRRSKAADASPLAVAALVCGMVGLVLSPVALGGIALGHAARRHTRRTGEGGYGMATAGLVLGYLVLIGMVVAASLFIARS